MCARARMDWERAGKPSLPVGGGSRVRHRSEQSLTSASDIASFAREGSGTSLQGAPPSTGGDCYGRSRGRSCVPSLTEGGGSRVRHRREQSLTSASDSASFAREGSGTSLQGAPPSTERDYPRVRQGSGQSGASASDGASLVREGKSSTRPLCQRRGAAASRRCLHPRRTGWEGLRQSSWGVLALVVAILLLLLPQVAGDDCISLRALGHPEQCTCWTVLGTATQTGRILYVGARKRVSGFSSDTEPAVPEPLP